MSIDILRIFTVRRINISCNIQIVVVALVLDFAIRNQTGIFRIILNLLVESGDNTVNILFTQSILVSVFYITMAGVNHKDALPVCRAFLINNKNTCRNTCAVKQVCRKADNTFYPAFVYNFRSDSFLSISSKQYAMRQNDCGLAIRFQSFQDMHQPSIVTILFRRSVSVAVKTAKFLTTICPVFHRERRICNDVIKGTKLGSIVFFQETRI